MANFRVHLGTSMLLSSALTAPLILTTATVPNLIIGFIFGIIGGLLPDIDSDNSKSISLIFTLLAITVSILFFLQKYDTIPFLHIMLISLFIFISIRYIIINIFRKFTKHRGMFHSIPSAVLSGLILNFTLFYIFSVDSFLSWIFTTMLISTYLSHLILDEIYSVDLKGARIKKSFGTALKLYMGNSSLSDKMNTFIIYSLLIILYFIAPNSSDFITQIESIPESYSKIKQDRVDSSKR